MSRILILSNGHGEDLSGSLLARELIQNGNLVHALPIVGKGVYYKKEKISIIGKTREFRTGGIGYNSLKGRLFEIFRGELVYFLQKLYLSYKVRKKYDFFLVVGDIVPVFFAWIAKKDFFTYLVAYSSHYEGRLKMPWPCRFFLTSKNSKSIYTRDLMTAEDLTFQLNKKVSFLGNPFMDKFSLIDENLKNSQFNIGLFPGSRYPESLDNFSLILDLLEKISNIKYFENIEFNFAFVDSLSAEKIKQILHKRGWLHLDENPNNEYLTFGFQSIKVNFIWNLFEEILFKSKFVISMAGTASEQAIGLAKPVVQIEGKGPQFTKSFAEAQRRLLGKYVFCASNFKDREDQINQTINLILKLMYFIKIDKQFLVSCYKNAKLRLGGFNSCIRIVDDLTCFMEK